MNKKSFFGVIFLVFSGIFVLINATITGAFIGGISSNFLSILSLIFLIIGAVLTKEGIYEASTYRAKREKIQEVIDQYDSGNIDVFHAVAYIDRVDPIEGVRFTRGKSHSIIGKGGAYPIALKEGEKAEDLAITEYLQAVKNNPKGIKENVIQISEEMSTKHHLEHLLDRIDTFKKAHRGDLKQVLEIA